MIFRFNSLTFDIVVIEGCSSGPLKLTVTRNDSLGGALIVVQQESAAASGIDESGGGGGGANRQW